MSAQAAEPDPADPDAAEASWEPYAVALAALVALAVAEAGRVFDRLVPPGALVEDAADDVLDVLAAALARVWALARTRAATLAAVSASGWLGEQRGRVVAPMLPAPPSEHVPRLTAAARTTLRNAAAMKANADAAHAYDAYLRASAAERDADLTAMRAELARLDRQADTEGAEALRVAEADALAADEAYAAEVEADAARAQAQADAEDAAHRARAEAEAARADRDRARRDAAEVERAERAAAAVEARAERRAAQRRRVQAIARAEAAEGAAEHLDAALDDAAEVVGWMRKLDPNPCERCVAWWASGNPGGASPVRPYSIRMKRHHGCQCIQRPVTRREADVRTITDEPEPAYRGARRRPADPSADADAGATGPAGTDTGVTGGA